MEEVDICYLCDAPILENLTVDHVPPLQFFPKSLRRQHNLQLITLLTHLSCNKSYERDEEYFKMSLGPLAKATFSGAELWKDIAQTVKRKRSLGLAMRVYDEFRIQSDGGIYYPPGKVAKKFDGNRVYRVVWKIIRGLHYYHKKQFLPEDTSHFLWLFDPQQPQPKSVEQFRQSIVMQQERGNHRGIFAYKIQESDPIGIYGYGLLLWDKILFLAMCHTPHCPCEDCKT